MNDDQNLNPTPVVPQTTPAITFDDQATEPMKLDEYGMPVDNKLPAAQPLPPAPVEEMVSEPQPAVVEPMTQTIKEDLPLAFSEPTVDEIPMTPPLPQMETSRPKKKWGLGGIVAIVVGIMSLGLVLGGAYYTYNVQQGQLAVVGSVSCKDFDTQNTCKGCTASGFQCKWRSETKQCQVSNLSCNPSGETDPTTLSKAQCTSPNHGIWCESVDSLGKSYAFCIDDRVAKGCNAVAVEKGYTIVYGASVKSRTACATADLPKDGQQQCKCGTLTVCFDKDGVCNSATKGDYKEPTPTPGQVTYYNKYGLCALVGTYDPAGNFTEKPDNDQFYSCTDAGCEASGLCLVRRYTCPEGHSGTCLLGGEDPKASYGFAGKCSTIEQIDVTCDGTFITSRTRINPPCVASPKPSPTPSPSPTATPVLSCTSLTKDKTDAQISIGTVVTLTCNGAVVPAGATTLTYKFRYNINSGAWTNLTNKTATTAQFTPNSCGTYSAQCQACGTINSQLVCDPTWTAASAQ